MSKERYIVVYLTETDGDLRAQVLDKEDIRYFCKDMDYTDYCVVKGQIIKDFYQKGLPRGY